MSVKLTSGQYAHLKNISNDQHVIAGLAIDQRESLNKMIAAGANGKVGPTALSEYKTIVSEELTKYTSAILLDPEYGLSAAKARDAHSGLLLSYERSGYDTTMPGRLPALLNTQSVLRITEEGGDAVKVLLYYDADEDDQVNDRKRAFVERVGAEAKANNLPFLLELVSYSAHLKSTSDAAYAKVKPHKVLAMTQEFSNPRFNVSVLKLEVPVNQAFVEGFTQGETPVYSEQEAADYYLQQSQATDLPFIFLSGGVSNALFLRELQFAHDAGSQFNGVLCGRATWKNGVIIYAAQGEAAERRWLQTEGKANIQQLNSVLTRTTTPWDTRVENEK